MIVSLQGRKIELTLAPVAAYPGDEEFAGNLDLELELPTDLKVMDLHPFLRLETPAGQLVQALGTADPAPGRISLTFHDEGWERATPSTVALHFGPGQLARKIADLPVLS